MAGITASDVARLRKMTGAGLMDCKNALTEANGDFDRAKDIIREKGKMIANNRADREATEGVITAHTEKGLAIMLSLCCETDFVAKNEDFRALAKTILDIAIKNKPADLEGLKACDASGQTVAELTSERSGVTGEKIEVVFYTLVKGDSVGAYVHSNLKVGAVIALNDTVTEEVSRNLCIQIASMNPVSIDKDDCSKEVIDRELEFGRKEALNEGNPEQLVDKTAQVKLAKFFKENALLNQDFVMGDKQTVGDYLKAQNPKAKVTSFKRFTLAD